MRMFALMLACSAIWISAAAAQESKPKLDQAALEKRFSERMANVVLVGRFTTDSAETDRAEKDKPLTEERYDIESVTKADGGNWTFLTRIKYGTNDVKIPVTVPVVWAGDTPVVSLTDLTIPAMGTYSARVLFYEDRYAGTWQHGKEGGHLFGRIEKAKSAPKTEPKESAKPQRKDEKQ